LIRADEVFGKNQPWNLWGRCAMPNFDANVGRALRPRSLVAAFEEGSGFARIESNTMPLSVSHRVRPFPRT
jgi:hypothetical protein